MLSDEKLKKMLDGLKEKLRINWTEDDELLKGMIKRSVRYFEGKTNYFFKWDEESTEYELLLERCRYEFNNALDDFEKNFASNILSLIMDYALKLEDEADG